MSFKYVELDSAKSEIRLLEIPTLNTPEDFPRFKIHHISLTDIDICEYNTISYCWGDPTPSHQITVNDLQINIPKSSFDVISKIIKLQQAKFIWIDAICINQTDFKERSQQVQLMRKVYSSAKSNLVFLGDVDNDEELQTIDSLHQVVDNSIKCAGFDNFSEYCRAVWRQEVELDLKNLSSDEEGALETFFARPWFRLAPQ